jgi:Carbohydrate esterase, sialic acid-specific acetylesterase/Prolyl oligopeptidase family
LCCLSRRWPQWCWQLALLMLLVSGDQASGALMEPMERQVIQRARWEAGEIPVSGTLAAGAKGVVEARAVGGTAAGAWVLVQSLEAGATHFHGTVTVPAGGWYRVSVRLRDGAQEESIGEVERVGMGEVFVVAGQSNSANHGEERQRVTSGRVSALGPNGWQVADDPQPGAGGGGGSFMPPFAEAMVQRFGVPVGIVAVGAGGTSVREWLPAGARFTNPPTVLSNVRALDGGVWESKGGLFANLSARVKGLGIRGCRAVLWHQGESDANQRDTTRTLVGGLYTQYLGDVIRGVRREAAWEVPWMVAQASYHTPDDPGSEDIRRAQAVLWTTGVALEGPNTDLLVGAMREAGGQGVHFSGTGLREHGRLWAEKVGAWLETQRRTPVTWPGLKLPGTENFIVAGRPAFLYLPPEGKRTNPQPWVLYGPTLPPLPDEAERWMHERFVAAGVAVVGVDVGEAYGSPKSHPAFDALHAELVRRGFASKGCLLGRSRGGLLTVSWGTMRPERVSGVAGIYPVYDVRSYPGVTKAAPAYGVTPEELTARLSELNPISRVEVLARAGVPAFLIHGDQDVVVPLPENSGEFVHRYQAVGAGALVKLVVLPGQGHNMFEGFFRSTELVDFVIERARAGQLTAK